MSIDIDIHNRNNFTVHNEAGDRISFDRGELEMLIVEAQDVLSRTESPEPLELYNRAQTTTFAINENGVEATITIGNEATFIDIEDAEAIIDWLHKFANLS